MLEADVSTAKHAYNKTDRCFQGMLCLSQAYAIFKQCFKELAILNCPEVVEIGLMGGVAEEPPDMEQL